MCCFHFSAVDRNIRVYSVLTVRYACVLFSQQCTRTLCIEGLIDSIERYRRAWQFYLGLPCAPRMLDPNMCVFEVWCAVSLGERSRIVRFWWNIRTPIRNATVTPTTAHSIHKSVITLSIIVTPKCSMQQRLLVSDRLQRFTHQRPVPTLSVRLYLNRHRHFVRILSQRLHMKTLNEENPKTDLCDIND